MGHIEKTVFISYRRTNFPWAYCIYQDLTHHGFDVFFDYQSIDSGNFEKVILENIRARAHFIIILSPSALERCSQPGDWLRREIETAMDEERNIIPVMLEGFDFGSPSVKQALTGKLASLNGYNGMSLVAEYVEAGFEKLRNRFLNVALEDVHLHILAEDAKEITETQKTAANEAPPVEKDELTAQTWFERGFVFQEAKNLDEAFRCYSEAIRLDPNLDAAHNNLGILLKNLKRYEEAETAYRKAIELDPSYATAYNNLGILLRNLKRYEEAEAAFRKAIELDPSDATAYNNLGNLLSDENLKRYEEAEVAYRKAIELDPSYAAAYNNLGSLLDDLKRYEEAEAAFRKAIELDPSDAAAYYNLGILLRNLKRYEEAEAAYRKAIELDPSYATAYSNLGNLLRNLNRYEEAEAAYRKAIELDPSDARAYSNLGLLLHKNLKRYEEAEAAYRKAIELDPSDATAYYNLGCLESVRGNFDSAFEYLQRAAQSERFNPAWAWEDPDLQWIRTDPRFTKIAGPKPA